MFSVWIVEYGRSEADALSSIIAGNFPARIIASPQSLLHLLAITNVASQPDVIVFNDGSVRNPMEIMGYLHALRASGTRAVALVASSSSQHWVELALKHFAISELDNSEPTTVLRFINHLESQKAQELRSTDRGGATASKVEIGDITFDRHSRAVSIHGQNSEELSPKELRILETLAAQLNSCVTRADLAAAVWPGIMVSQRTLDSHMSRLRKKISASTDCYLEAVYGEGYCLKTGD